MTTKKKPHAKLLSCEARGGNIVNGTCIVTKKSTKKTKMEALKIKAKL